MCLDPATNVIKELAHHVNSTRDILLVTSEVEVPAVYEQLHSLVESKSQAHVKHDSSCVQIDLYNDGAVSLRGCPVHSSVVKSRISIKRRGGGAPVGRSILKDGRSLRAQIGIKDKEEKVVHSPPEEVLGNGTHILNCRETQKSILSLEAHISRDDDDLVNFQVDRFSVKNEDGCRIYLNKWTLEVSSALDGSSVHKFRPQVFKKQSPIRGVVQNTFRGIAGVVPNPLAPATFALNAERTNATEKAGIMQSWTTAAAPASESKALLSWSTQLWMQPFRKESRALLSQTPDVLYLQGDYMGPPFTINLHPDNPGVSFKIPRPTGPISSEFPSARFKAKLKASFRGSRMMYKTFKLVEVEQEFHITNVFDAQSKSQTS